MRPSSPIGSSTGDQAPAVRSAKLANRFVELREQILVALNNELRRFGDDPKYASIGSFDEALILEGDDFSVHVVSVNSRSLFQDRYIAGNVSDQLLANPCSHDIPVRIYQQSFQNDDFKRPRSLTFQSSLSIAPGKVFFAAEDSTIVLPDGGRSDCILLVLRSRPRFAYNWMYDAHDLKPKYSVCVDPNITQTLFVLNAFARTGMQLPADLRQRLSAHNDFSVRWGLAEYMLRNEPHLAVGWLRELADRDRDLSCLAAHCLKVLQDKLKDRRNGHSRSV